MPNELKKILVFNAVFDVNGIKVPYKKEFQEANFDDIVVDFNVATGKVVQN